MIDPGVISYSAALDDMNCSCGNTSGGDGFVACNEVGIECEPDQHWNGRYICQSCGATIRLESYRPPAPSARTKFSAVRDGVVRGSAQVARAISHTMARRIANALNAYKPSSRGF